MGRTQSHTQPLHSHLPLGGTTSGTEGTGLLSGVSVVTDSRTFNHAHICHFKIIDSG